MWLVSRQRAGAETEGRAVGGEARRAGRGESQGRAAGEKPTVTLYV